VTRVTFRDKNNLVRIEVAKGSAVSMSGARAELSRLKQHTVAHPRGELLGPSAADGAAGVFTGLSKPRIYGVLESG
jgi:hypothetical protein